MYSYDEAHSGRRDEMSIFQIIMSERSRKFKDLARDLMPCKDTNVNVCVAEGCYGEACIKVLSPDGEYEVCDEDDCNEQIKNHAWGRIKADGWFFSKSGEVKCPTHVPEWYHKWKKVRR